MRAAIIALAGIGMLLGSAVQASPVQASPASARHDVRPAPARVTRRLPPRKPLMEQARGPGLVTAVISEREAAAAAGGPEL